MRYPKPYTLSRGAGRSRVVLVCEHASAAMAPSDADLGLAQPDRFSHIAWDIGALGVAQALSAQLDAPLLAGNYSRLLVDCNRFPDHPEAILAHSAGVDVPGNAKLSAAERAQRIAQIHTPFHRALSELLDARGPSILVTVHSFTPVFCGQVRELELGLLADTDERLAQAMAQASTAFAPWRTRVNAPYDANSGVSFTVRTHALARGWPHLIVELRQDLIADAAAQPRAATRLATALHEVLGKGLEGMEARASGG